MENINYNNLNKMIMYIEENLQNNIDYNELAKIVGVSEYSLQRIFMFITGISISDYIKKRRLSKAYEELKNTDSKVIDIALKYQYNSLIAFDRAFKKTFGITPLECRNDNKLYKQFPVIKLKSELDYKGLEYEVKEIKDKEIYCYKTKTNKQIDLLYKIRELYKYLKDNKIHEKLKQEEQYAISLHNDKEIYYIVGSTTKYTSSERFKIPSGKYAVFEVGSREQKDIVELLKKIYSSWIPSTNIKIRKDFSLEYYKDNNCYLYMPIEECA